MDDNQIPSDLLTGDKLSKLFESGDLRDKLKGMSRETLEFASKESNNEVLVSSVLKSLQKSEPEKANVEYAAKVVEVMRNIAKNILSGN